MQKPSADVLEIVDSCLGGNLLSHKDALRLCEVESYTPDYYVLLSARHELNRRASDGIAEMHGQIGIDANPCSKNCEFCSFAVINSARPNEIHEMPLDQILTYAQEYYDGGANALSLMITADYDFQKYLRVIEACHAQNPDMPIMANMGDFDLAMANELKAAGASFVYHAIRMGEGIVNSIPREMRVKTIEAAHAAGMKVATCMEMISPRYTYEEILENIELSVSLRPEFGAAYGMVQVPGTKMYGTPQYSDVRVSVFDAIYRMMAGTDFMRFTSENMGWAEVGTNPRDDKNQTEKGGLGGTIYKQRLFEQEKREWNVYSGPSEYWRID